MANRDEFDASRGDHPQESPYAAPGERKEGLTTGMPGDLSEQDVADLATPSDQAAVSVSDAAPASRIEGDPSQASHYTPPGERREGFEGA